MHVCVCVFFQTSCEVAAHFFHSCAAFCLSRCARCVLGTLDEYSAHSVRTRGTWCTRRTRCVLGAHSVRTRCVLGAYSVHSMRTRCTWCVLGTQCILGALGAHSVHSVRTRRVLGALAAYSVHLARTRRALGAYSVHTRRVLDAYSVQSVCTRCVLSAQSLIAAAMGFSPPRSLGPVSARHLSHQSSYLPSPPPRPSPRGQLLNQNSATRGWLPGKLSLPNMLRSSFSRFESWLVLGKQATPQTKVQPIPSPPGPLKGGGGGGSTGNPPSKNLPLLPGCNMLRSMLCKSATCCSQNYLQAFPVGFRLDVDITSELPQSLLRLLLTTVLIQRTH